MVIGATNRSNMIESTLRRPGRLYTEFELPDENGHFEFLQIKAKYMQLDPNSTCFEFQEILMDSLEQTCNKSQLKLRYISLGQIF
jgi:ATP-dependent 26S proteasome regulatory subunit